MADNGHHVVQGWRLDADSSTWPTDLAPGETVVQVPADVVEGVFSADHPALRIAADDTYLVRGRCLDEATHAQLRDLADNETAVELTDTLRS